MQVNVVDAIMGVGKTSAAINYMKNNKDNKFIYITPYINEVERICSSCPGFKQPISYNKATSKLIDLKSLLNKGTNIVTTHALFHLFDDEIIDMCYVQKYILIMDEVAEVVKPYHLDKKDFALLMNDHMIEVDDKGIVHWVYEDNYNGEFNEVKKLCDLECLAVYNGELVIWLFPIKIFNAFRESWILTYMFDAQTQKYYYDFYDIEYVYKYVKGDSIDSYAFTDEPCSYNNKYNYRELINIVEDEKLNMIGDLETALSKGWYKRNENNILVPTLKKNLYNFFNNRNVLYTENGYTTSTSKYNLWTTFKDYKKILSGNGYAKGFLSSNSRATNEYREKTVVAYAVNKYFNPMIKQFFIKRGVEVNEDRYAVSEMLQFIWRSGIRDGKHITLYIPSKRMRGLLIEWINSITKE